MAASQTRSRAMSAREPAFAHPGRPTPAVSRNACDQQPRFHARMTPAASPKRLMFRLAIRASCPKAMVSKTRNGLAPATIAARMAIAPTTPPIGQSNGAQALLRVTFGP